MKCNTGLKWVNKLIERSIANKPFRALFKTKDPKLNRSFVWCYLYIQKQLPEVFCEKGVLRNFAKCTGKSLCQSFFLNKVAGLRQTLTHVSSCEKRTPFII